MKSVVASLALEWIEAEFDPAIVVVWRHPLNLVPAWTDQQWLSAAKTSSAEAVRARFERSPVWPAPEGRGARAVAWAACAESVLLHETAAKHPDWIVVSHENQCLNPATAFADLYARLGLTWTDLVERSLTESDVPGSGFETKRRAAQEPKRWSTRLSPAEQQDVGEIVRAFEELSPVSADLWRASPAVT